MTVSKNMSSPKLTENRGADLEVEEKDCREAHHKDWVNRKHSTIIWFHLVEDSPSTRSRSPPSLWSNNNHHTVRTQTIVAATTWNRLKTTKTSSCSRLTPEENFCHLVRRRIGNKEADRETKEDDYWTTLCFWYYLWENCKKEDSIIII